VIWSEKGIRGDPRAGAYRKPDQNADVERHTPGGQQWSGSDPYDSRAVNTRYSSMGNLAVSRASERATRVTQTDATT
jgi:hypothetical protein